MRLNRYLSLTLCCLLFLSSPQLAAHTAAMDSSLLHKTDVALLYLKLGFTHILPLGADHILFILSIFLLNPKLKSVIIQATAFTLAHSITLGLAMYHVVSPPADIVEPVIALSIFFVAAENCITGKLKPTRIVIVFIFGLIHGLGFANALTELGLPQDQYFISLLLFNAGVELGQITIIVLAWLLIGKWFDQKKWYRKRVVIPISVCIAFTAFYWTIQRIV